MKQSSFVATSLLGWLAPCLLTTAALAQDAPPPPIPAPISQDPGADPYAASTDPYASDSAAAAPDSPNPSQDTSDPYASDPYATDPSSSAPSQNNADAASATANDVAPAATAPAGDYDRWARKTSLQHQNTLSGSTGLLRVRDAGSGAVGTFRFAVQGGFNGMSGFLCTPSSPCPSPITGVPQGEDSSQRTSASATLSVTPFSFLEVFAGVSNSATSNSNGTPELLSVVGDWNLGVKGFMPKQDDGIFQFGGEAELLLLTGTGGVGLDGAATSVALRGLATVDLNNKTNENDRIPLRFLANLGYLFDNSGAVVETLETTPPPVGRGAPIQRTERYGLGLSRVDAFEFGIGAEYVNDWIRPFLDFTVDIPVNRQGYVCNVTDAASRGDLCLGAASGFTTTPSRLTIGARGYPWQKSGLSLTAAVDIGTGATSTFLEEVTPEAPYTVWLALGYAVDTNPIPPPAPAPEVVEGAPQVRRFVSGQVVTDKDGVVIPDAIIRYENSEFTGMVGDHEGRFVTTDLPPGEYNLKITAAEFKDSVCTIVVPALMPTATAAADGGADTEVSVLADPYATEPSATQNAGSTGDLDAPASRSPEGSQPYINQDGNVAIPAVCKMKEMPRIATIRGILVDQATGGPIADATVTITDSKMRNLTLQIDREGAYQFRNVPFGLTKLRVQAPGYLTTVTDVTLESRDEVESNIVMNRRPQNPTLRVSRDAIKLTSPIHFVAETEAVSPDSMAVVEELALLLSENEDIGQIEIQVHTDDAGAASYSRRLSQQRADRIQALLLSLGVEDFRLVAKGFGPDQPLVPNVSSANRAKNNRVEIAIKSRN